MKKDGKNVSLNTKLVYDEKSDKFLKFVLPHPLSVCYKINQKCNYSCAHCLASGSSKGFEGLPTDKIKMLLKTIRDAGVVRLDITGGEPYLRSDIDEILKYAVNLGLEVVITTNGSLLTKNNVKNLKKLKILVQTSIDGNKDLNDQLRGAGAYDASMKAIEMLKNAGVQVRINFTVQKKNIDHIDDIIQIATNAGVDNVYFILISAQGRAGRLRTSVCLSNDQEKEVRSKILKLRLKSEINVKILDFKNYSHACVLIEPNGDFISQSWDEKDCINTGNLFKKDLELLWKSSNSFDHALHLMQYLRHPMLYR